MARHHGIHQNQHTEQSTYLGELLLAGRLDDWLSRVTTYDEDTGCMLWDGGLGNYSSTVYIRLPRALPPKPGRMRMVQATRMVWEIARGRPIPKGSVIYHVCEESTCIAPRHLACGTREKLGEHRKQLGLAKHSLPSRIKIAVRNRERSPASVEKAQAIRLAMQGVPHGKRLSAYKELSEKLGLTVRNVQRIANGRSWKNEMTSGVWLGLLQLAAANDERKAA